MTTGPLSCSVRGCHLPLIRRDAVLVCAAGHSYDIARAGYVNLLQPQDRRSPAAGDGKLSVAARASLLDAGVGCSLLEAVVSKVLSLATGDDPVIVDLGSGSGDTLAAVAAARPVQGVGIDLSTAATEFAARRFPDLTWVVANADRRLPVLDGSVQVVLSIHGRRNPGECARVLSPGGFLLIAVPAADDLIELREVVLGAGLRRERSDALLSGHDSWFVLKERSTTRDRIMLDRAGLLSLLQVTYRGARRASAARIEAVDALEVTLASEIFVFARR